MYVGSCTHLQSSLVYVFRTDLLMREMDHTTGLKRFSLCQIFSHQGPKNRILVMYIRSDSVLYLVNLLSQFMEQGGTFNVNS